MTMTFESRLTGRRAGGVACLLHNGFGIVGDDDCDLARGSLDRPSSALSLGAHLGAFHWD